MSAKDFSIFSAANECPDSLAVRTNERDWTFSEIACLVQKKIKKIPENEQVFPLIASSTLDTLVDIYALLELRKTILLIHPKLTELEIKNLLSSFRWSEGGISEDCAVILFTSGTTGKPKPAMISRRALVASAESSACNIPLERGDVWQLSISPARIGGFSIVTRSLRARSAVSLPSKFEPEHFVEELIDQKVSFTSLVPTMLAMIFDRFPNWTPPKTLKAILLGGSSASRALKEKASRQQVPIVITYGMTESSSNVVTTPYQSRFEVTEGCGQPNAGVQLRINQGIVEVKGPMLMDGYWRMESIDRDEWFSTGDIGFLDEKGNVHIQARRTDVIVSGGENVYPVEVEEALETIDGIKEARVVGMSEDIWGAIVTALLVPKSSEKISNETIVKSLSRILAQYKSPRRITWVSHLPVLSNGKPDRTAKILEGLTFEMLHYTHH